ncbi:hypothetical protein MICRO8M_30160 [Microbacterium sp. 8M]|uniref:LysE family transporter n=1 Tax=Microbacterium sp. 8M TaxID=2653153 RepID=UPI0012F006D1|nr:LysE family transporter [Microbacterium sp. 8M]VXB67762.1 hypothetical protein MICRO8M_30160 [Microbacterium sp. 8M]
MTLGQALLSFALVVGLLTIIPGLDTALVVRGTVTRGRPYGVAALLGIQVGTLGLLLALVHCALGAAWLGALIFGADRLAPRLRSARVIRWMDRITGGVLMLFGARLAVDVR